MEQNLIVQLSDEKYEYDVHSIVKAFFPERNVKVFSDFTESEEAEIEIGISEESCRTLQKSRFLSPPPPIP